MSSSANCALARRGMLENSCPNVAHADYEQKSSELALVLQAEKDNLQAVQKEIQSLNSGEPSLVALVRSMAALKVETRSPAVPYTRREGCHTEKGGGGRGQGASGGGEAGDAVSTGTEGGRGGACAFMIYGRGQGCGLHHYDCFPLFLVNLDNRP